MVKIFALSFMVALKDNNNLSPIWEATLEIYKVFSRICNSHRLKFFLSDGSALGAVRHHGFIPWDDDIDVSMPREDYEKFIHIALEELPSHLCVVTMDNTEGYNNLYAKVQETRRDVVERVENLVGYTLSSGIFIDIFPIDGYTGSVFATLMAKFKSVLLDFVTSFRRGGFGKKTFKGKVAYILGACLSVFYRSVRSELQISKAYLSCYGVRNLEGCAYAASVRCWRNKRLVLKHDIWGEPVYADFCGLRAPLPAKYEEYLSILYGAYMELPPIECRKSTHSKNGVHEDWWLGSSNRVIKGE